MITHSIRYRANLCLVRGTNFGEYYKEIEVVVYSKYPAVRLYVNDTLVGEKQTGVAEEFKALFTLPYAPGEIRAVGIEKGEEKESTLLQTLTQCSEKSSSG